jgi:hypothetical protein
MSGRWSVAIVLVLAVRTFAGVYSYECNSLPTDAGWTLLQVWCDPEEWVQDGRLHQRVEFCPGYDPPEGQQFDYRRSLAEFEGRQRFFVEWRIETDGHRSEIPFGAPAGLSASNGGSVLYHFVIAADQIRFLRDNLLPIWYIDVKPNIPHVYRLELFGDALYALYIDGILLDSGVPEGTLLLPGPAINLRAKAQFVESTTVWDYIRWGDIPLDATGDFDSDSSVDGRDFYFFHECLTNDRPGINGGPDNDAGPGCRFADFDADADVDLQDFAAFQQIFTDSH